MKRLIIGVLILTLLLGFTGCGSNDIRMPVSFYYYTDPIDYNSASGVVSAEIRDRDGYGDDLTAILDLYLQGPDSESFRTPFQDGTKIVALHNDETLVEVLLNQQFSNLTGQDLTMACVCISMTVIELTGCETVKIRAENGQLDDNDYIEMSRNDLLFVDAYTPEN